MINSGDRPEAGEALVIARDLCVDIRVSSSWQQATRRAIRPVDQVNLSIPAGQTLGLVGESGCGKSTLGRALLRLQEPTGGWVRIHGTDWTGLAQRPLRRLRQHAQMIFQDPFASFNPRMSVGAALAEPLRLYRRRQPHQPMETIDALLAMVELDPRFAQRRPHECSGGQLQRIAIARALAVAPEFIVADEPTSALDVSIQAQMMNLMCELQDRLGLAYLFISHNLAVVRQVSTQVAVMYLGRIVELGGCDQLFANPLHPYTQALVSAIPSPDPARERERKRVPITGNVPSLLHPPPGCHFHPRCPAAMSVCRAERPQLARYSDGHQVACHLYPPEPSASLAHEARQGGTACGQPE